jgi:FecR protein
MSACQVWISCFERVETGETLEAQEAVFLQTHRAECRRCAAEWNALRALALPDVLPLDSGDAAAVARALKSVRARARAKRTFAAAGVVALAAGLLLVAIRGGRPAPSFFVLSEKQGQVTLDGRECEIGTPFAAGERMVVKQGRACLSVKTGGQLCLAPETEVTLFSVDGPERTLHLLRGQVNVRMDHQPAGTRVGVHTDEGDVLAIGTVFRVTRNETVEVQVSEGRVLTRTESREEELGPGAPRVMRRSGLEASRTLESGPPSVEPVKPDATMRDLEVAGPVQKSEATGRSENTLRGGAETHEAKEGEASRVIQSRPPTQANPQTAEQKMAAKSELDGPLLLGPPLASRSSNSQHQILVPKKMMPPLAVSKQSARPVDGPGLLREARALRAQNKHSEAASVLERLIELDGQSEEAHAALLTLSDLELSPLKQPARALAHSRQYLAGSGELRDEAAFRELQALEALERFEEVATKRQQFLSSFPRSPHVRAVRAASEAQPSNFKK